MEDETHSGDSDSILISTIQNFSIEEQNEQLKKEIITLKAQFEDAIQIHSTIDKINDENAKLTKQVLDLKSEREEMERRLEIIGKANADLTEVVENQKKQYAQLLQNEGSNVQSEKNKIAQSFQLQIDSLHEELSELDKENNDIKLSQKVMASQIQRVIEAAGFYFKLSFSNLDDIISFFQTEIPRNTTENNSNGPTDNNPTNTQINPNPVVYSPDNKEKIKSLKKKLKARVSECKSLTDELDRIKSSHKREILSYQSQIEQLKKETNEKEHAARENIRDLQSTVNRLSQEINSSRDTISSLKVKNNELKYANKSNSVLLNHSASSIQELTKGTKSHDSKKDIEHRKLANEKSLLKEDINHLNEVIAELKHKQQSTDLKVKTLEEQLRNKESQLQKEQIQNQKIDNDLNALKIINSELKSENDSLRKTLHEKSDSTPKFKEQKHLLLEQQSKILEKKDEEICQLHLQIKQNELQSSEQTFKICDLKNQITNLEDELKKLKITYNDLVVKTEGTVIPTADDILPPSAFKTKYFEPELTNDIMKIASNTALQPSSKIDISFRTIHSYYEKKINKIHEQLEFYVKNEGALRNKVNQFIIDISIALNDQDPMTFDDLFCKNSECCQLIIGLITDCKTKFLSVTRERDQLISILTNIGQIVGFNIQNGPSPNYCDIIPYVSELKNGLSSAQAGFQQISKKYKAYCSESKALLKKCKLGENKYKKDISNLQTKICELEKEISTKSNTISKLKSENKQLQTNLRTNAHDLTEISESQLIKREDISFNSNEEFETMKDKFSKAVESYKIHIQQLQNKNEDLSEKVHSLENELAKSQQLISVQKSSNEQLNKENLDLTQQNSEIESILSSKYETAKNNLQQSFDQTIEKLKQQNEQSRLDLQKVMKQLKVKDDKIKELNQNIKSLINEKNKFANEANAIREQLEREKLIVDATVKTQILTIESKYKEQLDQQIARDEAERRSIIMYAVNAFRTIVSPASTMGVSTSPGDNVKLYKILIEKIKDIVTKLSESDQTIRKMLCAYSHQTTQDAVAQLLYNCNTNN